MKHPKKDTAGPAPIMVLDEDGPADGPVASVMVFNANDPSGAGGLIADCLAMASVGVGASWADKQHMQTYFGIAPDVALRTGRAAFQPGPGLKDLNAGMSLRMPLGGRWTLISGVGLSQLQGDAAASPLTRKTFGATALVAAAWTSR